MAGLEHSSSFGVGAPVRLREIAERLQRRQQLVGQADAGVEVRVLVVAAEGGAEPVVQRDVGEVEAAGRRRREAVGQLVAVGEEHAVVLVVGLQPDRRGRQVALIDLVSGPDEPEVGGEAAEIRGAVEAGDGAIEARAGDEMVAVAENAGFLGNLRRRAVGVAVDAFKAQCGIEVRAGDRRGDAAAGRGGERRHPGHLRTRWSRKRRLSVVSPLVSRCEKLV